jgi:hypothetical protein
VDPVEPAAKRSFHHLHLEYISSNYLAKVPLCKMNADKYFEGYEDITEVVIKGTIFYEEFCLLGYKACQLLYRWYGILLGSFYTQNGGDMFVRNVASLSTYYTARYPGS